jgi:dTDP-4-dehydrorhamnose reductase
MRFAVVGAGGQLGAAVRVELASAGHHVVPFDRAAVDITDAAKVSDAMRDAHPDAIVNCAAYNAVDAAEDHPVEALQVNAFAVRSLARAARAAEAVFVHYGTDFVFDGHATRPYTEEDRPNPRSVYAVSKLLGEWFAADAPRAYVLRVESLFGAVAGGPAPKGTIATIVRAIREGVAPKVFVDRTASPTSIVDAARATRALVEGQAPAGLYHCVNSGSCTWFELAAEVARILGVPPRLDAVRMADVPLRAARPQYAALSNGKLRLAGFEMPTWQEALARFLRD